MIICEEPAENPVASEVTDGLHAGSNQNPIMQCTDDEILASEIPDRSKRFSATSGVTSSSSNGPVTEKLVKRIVRSIKSVPLTCTSSSMSLEVDTTLGHPKRLMQRLEPDILILQGGSWVNGGNDGTERMTQDHKQVDTQERLKLAKCSQKTLGRSSHSATRARDLDESESSVHPGMTISEHSRITAGLSTCSQIAPSANKLEDISTRYGTRDASPPLVHKNVPMAEGTIRDDVPNLEDVRNAELENIIPHEKKDKGRRKASNSDDDTASESQGAISRQAIVDQGSDETDAEATAPHRELTTSAKKAQKLNAQPKKQTKRMKASHKQAKTMDKTLTIQQPLQTPVDDHGVRPAHSDRTGDPRPRGSKPEEADGNRTLKQGRTGP